VDEKLKQAGWMIFGSSFIFIIGLLAVGGVEQPQMYHQFADDRTLLGIPNALDVLSNLIFLFVGGIGLAVVMQMNRADEGFQNRFELIILASIFVGITGVFLGSVWYHLQPSDSSMVWDRIPMTIIFASLCSLIIADRLSVELAKKVHFPFIAIGILSVLFWHWSGDLRIYIFVKHEPILLILILLVFGTATYDRGIDWLVALWIFFIATALEVADSMIYDLTGVVAGHTLKHLAAGWACWVLLNMVRKRAFINPQNLSLAEE